MTGIENIIQESLTQILSYGIIGVVCIALIGVVIKLYKENRAKEKQILELNIKTMEVVGEFHASFNIETKLINDKLNKIESKLNEVVSISHENKTELARIRSK